MDDDELRARLDTGLYDPIHMTRGVRPEMVSFGASEPLEGARHTRVYPGGVAVIDIAGPIYRHASDASSGAVSTGRLARDLMLARKDEKVRSILMLFDTPGGEATGGDELAQKIHEVSKEKPVEAFGEGLMASLGYYFAAPTKRITASKMSLIGSIGVVIGVPVPKGTLKVEGDDGPPPMLHEDKHGHLIAEIVSSISPNKRANVTTKEGLAYYRAIVNETADVFVQDVARFRNLKAEDVPAQYGDGGVSAAQSAKRMGLIDDVDTFENVHDRMARAYYQAQAGSTVAVGGANPEAANGGDGMGLMDRFKQKADAGSAAPPKVEGDKGQTDVKTMLAELYKLRPGLEQRLEDKAILFATQQVTGHKVPPVAEPHVAYEMLTALTDDALFGGTVLFCTTDEAGNEKEVEGTRAQQIEAKYAAMPTHSLADDKVRAVREGSIQGRVLREADPQQADMGGGAHSQGQRDREDGDFGTEMSADDVLKASNDGRRALAARNSKPDAKSDAVN